MNPHQYKFLGVLPYAYDQNEIVIFLLGQERYHPNFPDSLLWGSFGGKPESRDKSIAHGASREAWEESMGFLGTQDEIYDILSESKSMFTSETAVTYLIPISYNLGITDLYERVYQYTLFSYNSRCQIKKGFYEKVAIGWFYTHDILRHKDSMRPAFYRFFTKVVMPGLK